jgi:hypothetical protein
MTEQDATTLDLTVEVLDELKGLLHTHVTADELDTFLEGLNEVQAALRELADGKSDEAEERIEAVAGALDPSLLDDSPPLADELVDDVVDAAPGE